ncbi:TlpA family protein disulfide reductase [Larkinella humicola]|uniref:TlpA family protein disulfide reductase n=1 Tax=Larkinella humicola TaxID=2607654 RepID=A0A5N1JKU5_9BACT|nr:TlpA disulfide reductase family protein [Larkinella humicola]KAA9357090.1 TlpA family protein disulfide reductase [Larkinella humicola]
MKHWVLFGCIFLILSGSSALFSQRLAVPLALKAVYDSTAYSFSYIHPVKNKLKVKLPAIPSKYSTLSRSFKLKALEKDVAVLIGKTISNKDYVVIDQNFNSDLSDDEIVYFPDTLTSPARGNYKSLKINAAAGQYKSRSILFDYSIIKPPKLQIDHGDSTENKVHFFIRPNEYKQATIKVDTATYSLMLFSKTVFDYTKKSTFLVVVPPNVDPRSVKANTNEFNKYVEGDIVLVGLKKFLFEKVSPLADSIFLQTITSQEDTYGSKVGYMAHPFSRRDMLSKDSVSSKTLKGKYIVLDFRGTWCAPCLQILESIKKMHATVDEQKVAMIGVCYDKDPGKVEAFIKKREITSLQLYDPQTNPTLSKQFGITAYPSFVVIDSSGKIVFKDEGLTGFQRLSEQLDRIIKK